MFGDEVACTRMQRACKKGAHDQVYQGLAAGIPQEKGIEQNLDDDVEEVNSGKWQLVDHHWTKCVEEDLEGAEECLAQNGVKEDGL